MDFFVGLDHPHHAEHFDRACINIGRMRKRKKPINCPDVLLDSGAFTELATHGRYRHSVAEYAASVRRLEGIVNISAAVAQDYMCEPFIRAKTGMSVADHQRLTIERYDQLLAEDLHCPVLPVLQGFAPLDYISHLAAYGDRLPPNARVGVGSICKRNSRPEEIMHVLDGIHRHRPDLKLHGFGVKLTALLHPGVRTLLHSADSMAWSFAARWEGRDQHDWREAQRFAITVENAAGRAAAPWQMTLSV